MLDKRLVEGTEIEMNSGRAKTQRSRSSQFRNTGICFCFLTLAGYCCNCILCNKVLSLHLSQIFSQVLTLIQKSTGKGPCAPIAPSLPPLYTSLYLSVYRKILQVFCFKAKAKSEREREQTPVSEGIYDSVEIKNN